MGIGHLAALRGGGRQKGVWQHPQDTGSQHAPYRAPAAAVVSVHRQCWAWSRGRVPAQAKEDAEWQVGVCMRKVSSVGEEAPLRVVPPAQVRGRSISFQDLLQGLARFLLNCTTYP